MKDVFAVFKMMSFCVSENVLPLTKKTPVESAVLQCGLGQIVPTAKRTWPHEAQTTFECGLSDPISNASWTPLGCVQTRTKGYPLVIGSLRDRAVQLQANAVNQSLQWEKKKKTRPWERLSERMTQALPPCSSIRPSLHLDCVCVDVSYAGAPAPANPISTVAPPHTPLVPAQPWNSEGSRDKSKKHIWPRQSLRSALLRLTVLEGVLASNRRERNNVVFSLRVMVWLLVW